MSEAAPAPVRSTRVLGNLDEGGFHAPHAADGSHLPAEVVRLSNADLARRVLRLRTQAGREVSVRLASGSPALRAGDVLAVTETSYLVVEPEETQVIVVRPATLLQMGQVAHALGNRHLQVQFFDAESTFGQVCFLTPADHTVAAYLDGVDCPYTSESVKLDVPFRHAEHTH